VEIRNLIQEKQARYKEKIFIIEDASHALGSWYKGSMAGSCTYSDMTVMSFHPVKHITSGEGGVVFTNNDKIYKKLKLLRSHGITNSEKDLVFKDQAYGPDGLNPWYYEQQALGFNYRMTDIQCALGISQLKKIDFFLSRRRRIVDIYNRAFAGIKYVTIPCESPHCFTNWHLYVLQIDFDAIGKSRAVVIKALRQQGIITQVHYIPVHLQPYYQKEYGYRKGDYPNAEKYYEQAVSSPLYPTLSKGDIEKVIVSLRDVFGKTL
jgi:dTDP-4-amino-4,6-dideoxygalactose transaminase